MSSATAPALRRFTTMQHVSNTLFIGMHLATLFVFVVPFSAKVAALAVGGYVLRMWAVTAGYHRYFAHRSYKTSRAFQLVLAVLGATAMQNGPLWWASAHRRHHKFADTPDDPHSPVLRGLFYAHIAWIFDRSRPPSDDRSNIADLMRFPELGFVDRHEWMPLVAYAFGCFAIGGWSGLVWGFVVSTLAVFHATLCINSLAHVWGSRRFATADGSRNNVFLALMTLGEGWHNNHHHYMTSARQGFLWWEIDVSYYAIRCLSWLGVVWDVREPPPGVALTTVASAPRGARPRLVPREAGATRMPSGDPPPGLE